MKWNFLLGAVIVVAVMTLSTFSQHSQQAAWAQEEEEAAEDAAPEPLSDDELEVLVARIALYPDELVAVITASSLYPLQIVEAARYLEQVKKDPDLKPKSTWDGGVVSLLNYPEIVTMMSDDLDWTQLLGDAMTYQQKDVLVAIQQLRDKAVAQGTIKSDDKIKVVKESDNIVIRPVNNETVYIPQYEPAMLYEPDYVPVPITYYPEPYPSYYYPTAPYFAGIVTGAVWASVVDWDDWGVWGGNWNDDIDINCNKCFNNIDVNGKVNFNDVDWKNVDRNKISIDKDQFKKIDKSKVKNSIKANDRNSIRNKSAELKKSASTNRPNKAGKTKDVRKSTLEGLKKPSADKAKVAAAKKDKAIAKPAKKVAKPADVKRPAKIDRPVGKPKPAAKADKRPKKPSGLGEVQRGKSAKINSNRGGKSMGGGARGGAKPHKTAMKRGGGRRR